MRWLSVALIVLLLAGTARPAVAGAGSAVGAGRGPAVPVILIPGAGAGPEAWGVPQAGKQARGLYRALLERGYIPERSLFWLDYRDVADGDPVGIARERLAPLVEQVLAAAGAAQVDLVAQGSGCLVARYYVSALGGGARVRTLVLVAPPNGGSAPAALYRLAGTVAEQERARRRAGGGRGRVFDPDALTGPFLYEQSYVQRVARDFFEPLYGRFAREEVFLRRTAYGGQAASFTSWLAARHPDLWQAAFGAGGPPLAAEGRGVDYPDPGAYLTRAYFHTLALAVARNHYRQFAPWTRVAVEDWEQDLVPAETPAEMLLQFAARRLLRLGAEALRRLGVRLGREAAVAGAASLAGLPYGSPAVARLVRLREPVSWGEPEAGQVVANRWLARLDAREAAGAAARPTRYVVVAGLVPGTGGDLAVAAGDALLPPGPLDVYRLERGPGANHLTLARSRRLHRFILDQLDPLAAAAPAGAAAGQVGAAAPAVFALRAAGAGPATVRVRPEGEPVPGMDLRAYLVRSRGGRVTGVTPLDAGGSPVPVDLGALAAAGERGYLAVRLVPRRGGRVDPAVLEEGRSQRFRIEVAEGPAAAGVAPAPAAPDRRAEVPRAAPGRAGAPAGTDDGWPPAPEGDAGLPPEAGTGDADPDAARDGRASAAAVVPRVDVVYRNKRTTDRVEDRTYHVRWEWDFGDGTTWVDDDPRHIVSQVSHSFPPGVYTVRARSVSNKGTILRELTWEVTVAPPGDLLDFEAGGAPGAGGGPGAGPGGGAVRTFRAETIREPVPKLALHGPRKWITGRPARFRVEAAVPAVPYLESVRITLHPAPEFDVVWARPGLFKVQAAAVVRLRYRLPEGTLAITNTYVVERQVDVLATSVTG